MLAVIQRVTSAECLVNRRVVGSIKRGLVVLLAIGRKDGLEDVHWMSKKIVNLRIFEDSEGKMNLSLLQTKGEILLVPQFTLYGDCRKGTRPSFSQAASPATAEQLFNKVKDSLAEYSVKVTCGVFGAKMKVKLENEGPVTLIVTSENKFKETIHG